MTKYAYQIQGALEDPNTGVLRGLRVLVCNVDYFETVDVPIEILDKETARFLSFRIRLTNGAVSIQRLPNGVQNKIRAPLGRWLDHWVLNNFHGDNSKPKSTNT